MARWVVLRWLRRASTLADKFLSGAGFLENVAHCCDLRLIVGGVGIFDSKT